MQAESLIAAHRGALGNPANRFESLHLETDLDWNPEEDPLPRTQFLKDRGVSIISRNESPDIGFDASVNPYRGCEHGCIYCYDHKWRISVGKGIASAKRLTGGIFRHLLWG